jgi:hypothetical protein
MTTPTTGTGPATATAGINARHEEQAVYGLGFDQHSAHARGRPIAWVVVAIIVAATCGCGTALILAAPWLFWTGVAVALLGIIVGRATHAFRDAAADSALR